VLERVHKARFTTMRLYRDVTRAQFWNAVLAFWERFSLGASGSFERVRQDQIGNVWIDRPSLLPSL
jgi:hypothetical protein